ncbi:MAG: ABC transporter ATP-binding protein [Planctomycetes bacterium]|nr:ABC transporter ATP-binding protein [Planctomycetota bacterium]
MSKRYGPVAALEDCTLRVERGEVLGLLGPNGAGKTTLIRLLLGFLRPTSGEARVQGLDCRRDSLAIRRRTAYLPGEACVFRGLRGADVLRFFADVRGIPPDPSFQLADRLELDLGRRVGAMSTGMRQKLAVALTIASAASLMILDEPTANLDPSARGVVLDLVRETRARGSTIVFSSHVLSEVEETCDRVLILRQGRVAHSQKLSELRDQYRITARVAGAVLEPPRELAERVRVERDADGSVRCDASGALAPVLTWLAALDLKDLRVESASLRAVYDRIHGEGRPEFRTTAT